MGLNALAYEIPAGATQIVQHVYDEHKDVDLEQIKLEDNLERMGLRALGGFRSAPAVRPGFRYLWCYAGPAEAQPEPPRGQA